MTYYRAAFAKSLGFKGEQHSLREDAKFAVAKGAIQLTSVATNATRLRIIYKKKVSWFRKDKGYSILTMKIYL